MSIAIGGNTLQYKVNEKIYITTYTSMYNEIIDNEIEKIFDGIFPYYKTKNLLYSNVCGANAEFICKNLTIPDITLGKLIIKNWVKNREELHH
jgi:hypothetical protein